MYPFLLKTGLLCWGGGAEGELTELLPLSVSIPLKDRTSLLGGGGGGGGGTDRVASTECIHSS